jgi:hypothetical protein
MTSMDQRQFRRTRTGLALTAIFLGTFVIGTAELVVVGLLNLIAGDTHVPVSTAGTVVTRSVLAEPGVRSLRLPDCAAMCHGTPSIGLSAG